MTFELMAIGTYLNSVGIAHLTFIEISAPHWVDLVEAELATRQLVWLSKRYNFEVVGDKGSHVPIPSEVIVSGLETTFVEFTWCSNHNLGFKPSDDQKHIFFIARAILSPGRVVIMNEPTGSFEENTEE